MRLVSGLAHQHQLAATVLTDQQFIPFSFDGLVKSPKKTILSISLLIISVGYKPYF